jgi:hypothetical protein
MSRRVEIWYRMLLAVPLVMLLGAAIAYFGYFRREYHAWSEDVRLWNGTKVRIQRHSSERIYHGGHAFGWGGGDPRGDVQFTFGEKKYRWEGPYIPIAIQPDDDGAVYLVVYDRESEEASRRRGYFFRIYRSRGSGSWDEIAPKDFPKHLALQNTWLLASNGVGMDGRVENQYEIVAQMDPADPWFRRSLTASLWSFVVDPSDKTDKNKEPSESFLREYKEKWIRPIGPYRPDGAPW